METKTSIELVKNFHERFPTARIFSVEMLADEPLVVRLYWYTDNDGGHMDFYC